MFVRLPDAPVVDAEGLNEQFELAGAAGGDVPVVDALLEEVVGLGRKVLDAVEEGRVTGAAVVTLGAGAVAFDVAVVAAGSVGVAVLEAVLLFDEAPEA